MIDAANAAFWDDLCGSWLARSLGVAEPTPEALARFDAAYDSMYPYLGPLVRRLGLGGKRVLEVGLGYGTLAERLATEAAEYHAVDIAREPVALANLRLQRLAKPELARQGSALDLPYPDATFDAVVSIGTLHHTGDLARAIEEVRRVVRPDGVVLLMVYNRWSLRRLVMVPRIRAAAMLGHLGGYRSAEERIRALYDAGAPGEAAPATAFTSSRELRRLLRGFRTVQVELRNIDDYRFASRARLLGTVDRVAGLDIYAVARA